MPTSYCAKAHIKSKVSTEVCFSFKKTGPCLSRPEVCAINEAYSSVEILTKNIKAIEQRNVTGNRKEHKENICSDKVHFLFRIQILNI